MTTKFLSLEEYLNQKWYAHNYCVPNFGCSMCLDGLDLKKTLPGNHPYWTSVAI